MSLRVTDVQAALRRYASLGHDVTTDPRMVHIDGKRYGMALGHTLGIRDNLNGYLHTLIRQSERPLISGVSTRFEGSKNGLESVSRDVSPYVATEHTDRDAFPGKGYSIAHFSGKGYFAEKSDAPSGSVLWTPYNSIPGAHKSVHEALEAHTTPEVTHTGQITDERRSNAMRYMTPREMAGFDHVSAMQQLNYGTPLFQGIVNVQHGDKKYQYHPDTEQLFEHHA